MPGFPETRYAVRGDIHLAFQVVGDGPIDVLFKGGHLPVDLAWEEPGVAAFLRRLASFSRVILWDSYGMASSDRPPSYSVQFDEEGADDVTCVMAATGSTRAVLVSDATADRSAMFFAATHPDRVAGLVLANQAVTMIRDDDFPWGLPPERVETFLQRQSERWGTGENLEVVCPSRAHEPALRSGTAAWSG